MGSTILCIDDDTDDLSFIHEAIALHLTSFEIREAQNGVEALQWLQYAQRQNCLPSLIITDINMPKMDGLKTIEFIKKNTAFNSIPIVIFSTSANQHDKDHAAAYHVPYFVKPNQYEDFAQKVGEILKYNKDA